MSNAPKSYTGGVPSTENMLDDVTGEPLSRRLSDNVKSLNTQIHAYYAKIKPIIAHYEKLQKKAGADIVSRVDASDDNVEHVMGLIRNQIH